MSIKVKIPDDCPDKYVSSRFTKGKEYVREGSRHWSDGYIKDDEGRDQFVLIGRPCAHLGRYCSWEVVDSTEEAEEPEEEKKEDTPIGMRYNEGKPPMQYIPARIIMSTGSHDTEPMRKAVWLFEERYGYATTILDCASKEDLENAARVFEFGANKYEAWNWTIGMSWMSVLACMKRHYLAVLDGEENDPESGLPHMGHFWCNVIMLVQYQEGGKTKFDDRPPCGTLHGE